MRRPSIGVPASAGLSNLVLLVGALIAEIELCGCNASVTPDDAAVDAAISDGPMEALPLDLGDLQAPLWPMYGHDAQRRALASTAGPTAAVTQKWKSTTQVNGYVVPVLDSSGNVFENFMPPSGLGVVAPATGQIVRSNGQLWRTITLGSDGTVFTSPAFYQLAAVDPTTLKTKWMAMEADDTGLPPAIASDGALVYLGSKTVFAVSPVDGTTRWSQPFPVDLTNNPFVDVALGIDDAAIAIDGTHCASFDPVDGHQRWSVTAVHKINFAPVIGVDGSIYLVEGDPGAEVYLTALDAGSGTVRWNVDLMTVTRSGPPAVAADGTILMLTTSRYQAFAPDGTPKWSVPVTATDYSTQPTVDPVGNSYFLADTGKTIVCMSPSGTVVWSAPSQTALNGAIVIGTGSVLFINGAFDENLYAFGP